MRFSDIQKDPRNYDTDILVGKLENYFTTTIDNRELSICGPVE